MKPTNFNSWRAALTRASVAALIGVLGGIAAPPAQADPCYGDTTYICYPGSPYAYHLSFSVTSPTPVAITGIVDLWGRHYVTNGEGDFSLNPLPQLPTGSGTLDGGMWYGEDAHFLLGMSGTDLVLMTNPATAALMTGRNFDDIVNGISPATPNPFPFTGVEAYFTDLITRRPVEWETDIWHLFNHIYYPAALDPTLLIGPSTTTTGVLMSFTDGKIIGTVDITAVPVPVPEPAGWVLMSLGALVLLAWKRRRTALAASLALLAAIAAPTAQAVPCGTGSYCNPTDIGAYHVQFDITSTTPAAITFLFDMWTGHVAESQGVFSAGNPPGLPTGSGRMDAGIWLGEDNHFLLGMAGSDLVMVMNPATAALMANQPFDYLINGIPPATNPNPYPHPEDFIIDRLTNRHSEWDQEIWSVVGRGMYDPTILIGPGTTTTGVLMSFTNGKIIGTVDITATPVPEPGSWALMLMGSLGLIGWLRRPRR